MIFKFYFLLLAAGIGVVFAVPCPDASLTFYRLPSEFGGGGDYQDGSACSVGQLNYWNFRFGRISDAGPITSSDIMIKPNPQNNGLMFYPTPSNDLFNGRVITTREQYYITYTFDPPPIIAGDELFLDPPDSIITVSKWGCADTTFNQNTTLASLKGEALTSYEMKFKCLNDTNPYFLQVNPQNLTDTVSLSQLASFVNVRIVIDLIPNCTVIADVRTCGFITGLDAIGGQTSVVPEPGFVLPLAAGTVGLFGVLLRRRRKANALLAR